MSPPFHFYYNCSILRSYQFWPRLKILMFNFIPLPGFPLLTLTCRALPEWSSFNTRQLFEFRIHNGSLIPMASNPHFFGQFPRPSRIYPAQCLSRWLRAQTLVCHHFLMCNLRLLCVFSQFKILTEGAYISSQAQGHRSLAPPLPWISCILFPKNWEEGPVLRFAQIHVNVSPPFIPPLLSFEEMEVRE